MKMLNNQHIYFAFTHKIHIKFIKRFKRLKIEKIIWVVLSVSCLRNHWLLKNTLILSSPSPKSSPPRPNPDPNPKEVPKPNFQLGLGMTLKSPPYHPTPPTNSWRAWVGVNVCWGRIPSPKMSLGLTLLNAGLIFITLPIIFICLHHIQKWFSSSRLCWLQGTGQLLHLVYPQHLFYHLVIDSSSCCSMFYLYLLF